MKTQEFKITQIKELYWEGKLGEKIICRFEYFKDEHGIIWVNNIATDGPKQRKGYGTNMIIEALKVYNEIFISTADKLEIKTERLSNDLRYTNDDNLWYFINKCVQRAFLKKEWIKHPF